MTAVEVTWVTDDAPSDAHALALAWMQPDERARHDRFAFEHTRAEFRLARWLVRTTLSRHTGVDPAAWRFAANAYGRPEIVGPEAHRGWRFNLSHTPGMVAIAVAHGREVGLDVEDTWRPGDLLGIAPRYFAAPELSDLTALPDEAEQLDRFFQLWTLKESYIKARGMGLALPLDAFWFGWRGPEVHFGCDARANDDPARWHFTEVRPTRRHRLALAAERLGGDRPEATFAPASER